MNNHKRAVTAFVAMFFCVIGAAVLFAFTGEAKEEWEYAFDKDIQSMVAIVDTVGVCCAIMACGHMVEGFVFLSASDEKTGAITTEKKGIALVAAFIGAGFSIVCALIIFFSTGGAETDWLDSLDRDVQTVVIAMRWGSMGIAVMDVIKWIAICFAPEEDTETDNIQKEEGRMISDGTGMVAGTVRCTACHSLMSSNAIKCLRCGTLLPGAVQNQNAAASAAAGNENLKMKKCLFCNEPMPEKQVFCGTCGRRQD